MTKSKFESIFPAFPNAIIQGVAKKFVNLYSPIRETPEGFLWLSFLVYFGNLISPYVRLDCASSEPRLFGVVIGKSGRTRKSAGINLARDLFKQFRQQQQVIEGFGSSEGMLGRLGDNKSPQPTVIHVDEVNLIASKTDIGGSAGVAAFHKLFEDHDYDHPLAKSEYKVRNAYLSLIGASTLEDFTKAWSGKHEDAGFFSRLLLVTGDTDKRIPRPIEPDGKALAELVGELQGLVSSVITSGSSVLGMDKDAEGAWATFYDSFGDGPEWNRIDTLGFRIMAIQAVLRQEKTVTPANVKDVIDFLQYEVAVRESVAPVVAENMFAKMEQLIRRYLPAAGTITKRELQRRTNGNRLGIECFDRAISNMLKNGEMEFAGTKGKSTLYARAESEIEDADLGAAVISTVIEANDDGSELAQSNNDAGFERNSENCLHAVSPDPRECEKWIM